MRPTERFSEKADAYAKYRPGYPAACIDRLVQSFGIVPGAVIADAGSGTGILSALFLDRGCTVYGIEPNPSMREHAGQRFHRHPAFHSVDGTAEATALDTGSVDGIVSGQAFHWFDARRAAVEFRRIAKPRGWCALIWNLRRLDSTPFLREYEAFLTRWGTDYTQVREQYANPDAILEVFRKPFACETFTNTQVFDRDGLRGRLLSSSYIPPAASPRHAPMLAALDDLFAAHETNGVVTMDYDTVMHFGHLPAD